MKCKHIQQQLLDYSEELLAPKERLLIEKHLHTCPDCREELHDIKETIHLLQSITIEEPPEEFWTNFTGDVMRKIKHIKTAPVPGKSFFFFPTLKMTYAVALLIVILGSIFWYYNTAFQPGVSPQSLHELIASGTPAIEDIMNRFPQELVSKELMNDILNADFALVNGETFELLDADNSNEMLYFLISTLSEEEKDRLLIELHKIK